jgi:hypothetical protein
MRRARGLKPGQLAQALDELLLATLKDSFEELEPRFKALEKRLLAVEASHFGRGEIRRRITEMLFTEAFARDCPWPIFGRLLRRIHRLGYSDVERRYHVAALYALWCHRHPEHDSREARQRLDDVERRILHLPRGHLRRTQLLEQLTSLRARTGFSTAPPPG